VVAFLFRLGELFRLLLLTQYPLERLVAEAAWVGVAGIVVRQPLVSVGWVGSGTVGTSAEFLLAVVVLTLLLLLLFLECLPFLLRSCLLCLFWSPSWLSHVLTAMGSLLPDERASPIVV